MEFDQNTRVRMTVLFVFALIGIVIGLSAGKYLKVPRSQHANLVHGAWLDEPRDIRAFSLIGIDNKPFTNNVLRDHWTILFFGFTSCPSVCPITMAKLDKMYQILEKQHVKAIPQIVMISLDPRRDNGDKLAHYVKAFNPRFYAARSDDEFGVMELAKEFGIASVKVPVAGEQQESQYNIEHTGTLMLVNPQGKLAAFLTMPHEAERMAKDYRRIVS